MVTYKILEKFKDYSFILGIFILSIHRVKWKRSRPIFEQENEV